MKKLLFTLLIATCATMTNAQQTGDTVIVELAKTSRVIFTIKDRSDLEILKHYDFQQLFQDVLTKLEKSDTSSLAGRDSTESDVAIAQESNTMMTTMRMIGAIEILIVIVTITSGTITTVAVDGAAHRSLLTLISERITI